ncbi:hypothetical protein PspLS_09783 [Pyricularia sp. CBS 133598]|nr:hypothetical protein PspLS_09783 [Pyricularia sp. CBS 133598]
MPTEIYPIAQLLEASTHHARNVPFSSPTFNPGTDQPGLLGRHMVMEKALGGMDYFVLGYTQLRLAVARQVFKIAQVRLDHELESVPITVLQPPQCVQRVRVRRPVAYAGAEQGRGSVAGRWQAQLRGKTTVGVGQNGGVKSVGAGVLRDALLLHKGLEQTSAVSL